MTITAAPLLKQRTRNAKVILLVPLSLIAAYLLSTDHEIKPEWFTGVDWHIFYYATQLFLHGGNPYTYGTGFGKVYEPFWTYLFLAPFAVVPFWIGRILMAVAGYLAYGISAIKMGAKNWQLVLFMFSSTVLGELYQGNITWLVLLGLWMPPQIGLFFILMKPQIGAGVALYWAYKAWVDGGWKQVARTFAPVTIAYGISFLLYGFWIKELATMPRNPAGIMWFPWLVPSGIILLFFSLKNKNMKLAGIATPMLAPYATRENFNSSLLCLFEYPKLFIAAWIVLWIHTILRTVCIR